MSWSTRLDTDGNIRVRVEGYLDADEAAGSVASIIERLGDRPRDLVLDAAAMQGYRRGARAVWQLALARHRGQIRRFVLVGGSCVVRMGASVMAMSLGLPLVVHDCEAREAGQAELDAPVRRRRRGSRSGGITRPISRPLMRSAVTPQDKRGGMLLRRIREESRPSF